MVAFDWTAHVEVEALDGQALGCAMLYLLGSLPDEGTECWSAELSASTLSGTKCWPDREPVRLRLPSGDTAVVRLETGMREVGPVLMQVAHVYGDPEQLKGLVLASLD